MAREVAEEVLERLAVGIGVDEDVAPPAPHLDLGQALLRHFQAGIVPLARDLFERTIQVPGPAVKRAAQIGGGLAPIFTQLAATVQAGVVVGLELVLPGAHHEERHAGDVVGHVVAHVGQVVFVTGHLPDALPDLLHLQVKELLGGVTLHRHEGGPRLDGRVAPV